MPWLSRSQHQLTDTHELSRGPTDSDGIQVSCGACCVRCKVSEPLRFLHSDLFDPVCHVGV